MKFLNKPAAVLALGICLAAGAHAGNTSWYNKNSNQCNNTPPPPPPACCLSIPAASSVSDVTIIAYPGYPGLIDSIFSVTPANNVGLQIDGTFALNANTAYAAWCVDTSAGIDPGFDPGTKYPNATFYSTCDLKTLNSVIGPRYQSNPPSAEQWRQVDWILNHRAGYSFINVQAAIWKVLGEDTSAINFSDYNVGTQVYDPTLVDTLVAAAQNSTWQPACGDKVAVFMVLPGTVQYIILEVPCVCPKPPANPGTGTPGFWKNHPDAWPVSSITVGCKTWTKSAAIAQLSLPDGGNKWNTMFRGVLCAKLNVLIGNDPSCIQANIAAGDLWLCTYPSPVAGSSTAWTIGSPIYTQLDAYNNGLLCAPHRN